MRADAANGANNSTLAAPDSLFLYGVETKAGLDVWAALPNKVVFKHLHLSNYGKFEVGLQEEAAAIAKLLREV
jgi:hypothetical protein